jgi:hypothetical protein
MRKRLAQAYRQAPWRLQTRNMLGLLVGLVIVLVVAAIYLSISGQAAQAGVEARFLEYDREIAKRNIAHLEARYGQLTSLQVMLPRAKELGFQEPNPDDIVYVVVPGYYGRPTFVEAPPPGAGRAQVPIIKPEYRQSIWDWLFKSYLTGPGG